MHLGLVTNIRLGPKCVNGLAYYGLELFVDMKSFIVKVRGLVERRRIYFIFKFKLSVENFNLG